MGGQFNGAASVRRAASLLMVLLGSLLLCACGGKSAAATLKQQSPNAAAVQPSVEPLPQTLAKDLPALGSLPPATNPGRKLSAQTPLQLLSYAPVSASAAGVNWTSGQVTLDPTANSGIAWAVFGVLAFPTDGSVYPLKLSGDNGQFWIGLSNYTTGRWEWHQQPKLTTAWLLPYTAGNSYVSPAGGTYVALMRNVAASHLYHSLILTASDQLFAPPVPDLQTSTVPATGGQLIAKYPVTFDFSGSSTGAGTLVSATFTPEVGAQAVTLPDLTTPFDFTYADGGAKTATLEIVAEKNGIQESASAPFVINVVAPERELLVVYNSNIPESVDLANYYVSPLTGRNIDLDYHLALPLADSASFNSTIDRATYASTIREPIKAFLNDPSNSALKANVKYLLLIKGVPHKVSGAGEFTTDADCSSVDSELCCLNSDTDNLDGSTGSGYPLKGALINRVDGFKDFSEGSGLGGAPAKAFYLGSTPFVRSTFGVVWDPTFESTPDPPEDDKSFVLDYLVGRIDGYSFDDAKAIIDRAKLADTSSQGWVIFDSTTGTYGQNSDTMVDPVWPFTQASDRKSGEELLKDAGFNVWADVTTDRITLSAPGTMQPPNFTNSVIGYAGWGVNHNGGSYPNGANYILNDLGWNYLPGACFSSYESFNATVLSCPDPSDPTIGHPGQGQICDFLHKGGTVAIGNAWEPFTVGCADERWFFDRYLDQGDRFIEAAYHGLRWLSWMEVVIGDPLCRVKP